MISIHPDGFDSPNLLRFPTPYIPWLVFVEGYAEPQKTWSTFIFFEGVQCIENMKVRFPIYIKWKYVHPAYDA